MAPYILVQVICLDSVILFEMCNVLTLIDTLFSNDFISLFGICSI